MTTILENQAKYVYLSGKRNWLLAKELTMGKYGPNWKEFFTTCWVFDTPEDGTEAFLPPGGLVLEEEYHLSVKKEVVADCEPLTETVLDSNPYRSDLPSVERDPNDVKDEMNWDLEYGDNEEDSS
jgi:hypothetical protein